MQWFRRGVTVFVQTVMLMLVAGSYTHGEPPVVPRQTPWATPRVTGSPEPPPKYRTVRLFPNVQFRNPVAIEMPPGDPRWWVAETGARLLVINPTEDGGGRADVVLDLQKDLKLTGADGAPLRADYLYGIAFHPDYERNHQIFLAYTVLPVSGGAHLADGTRVSRFKVQPGPVPRIDVASEELLLTFQEGGHNGACLQFGPEGFLYVSTGDAGSPTPPDPLATGQDNTDLLSCILRIDVDHPAEGQPYSIPKDNPFLDRPDFRPEIWAFGFRNPWKMSFDRANGDLWLGDIGWELWEMIYRVERGANYGWAAMEGPQPIRIDLPDSPIPITPPLISLPHTTAASITGGYVYRGKKFPELVGTYISGDWETHRIWSLKTTPRPEGTKPGDHVENGPVEMTDLVIPELRVIDFGQDHQGELVVMDYDNGTIHGFERRDVTSESQQPFPTTLSQTGLFSDVATHQVAPGVEPFDVAAEMWSDGLVARRFVAVPHDQQIISHRVAKQTVGSMFRRHFEFPKDSVLMKTLSLPEPDGRRIETQILHFDGLQWVAYSYRWKDDQSDATLVEADGDEGAWKITDPTAETGERTLRWTFASRSQCMTCHTGWAEHTLGWTSKQLLTAKTEGGQTPLNQLASLGLFRHEPKSAGDGKSLWDESVKLVPPFDERFPLDRRARSYLDANCAHCHQFGGGGSVQIELRANLNPTQTGIFRTQPTKGTFGLNQAQIVAPGDPYRSVLFLRMAKCGTGRMPHLASERPDEQGLRLIEDWIRSLEPENCVTDQKFAGLLKTPAADLAGTLSHMVHDPNAALYLARVVDRNELAPQLHKEVQSLIASANDPIFRDLFARHLPEPPADRVGTVPRPRLVLNLAGDVDRGRELFHSMTSLQCKVCHRVTTDEQATNVEGGRVGPNLARIGQTRKRDELIASLLTPSALIDPAYVAYAVERTDGQILSGVVAERTNEAVILRDAKGDQHRLLHTEIEAMKPLRTSLMPDGLLKDLTLQQAADLLEYLQSLR